MKARSVALVLLLGSTLASCSCNKKTTAKKEEVTAVAPKQKNPVKKAPKKPRVDQDLVRLAQTVKTEEDFETTVEKDIVPDNLEEQVDKLDQEITPPAE
jgi:hypothetical protein